MSGRVAQGDTSWGRSEGGPGLGLRLAQRAVVGQSIRLRAPQGLLSHCVEAAAR
jgi:hypothetical protein